MKTLFKKIVGYIFLLFPFVFVLGMFGFVYGLYPPLLVFSIVTGIVFSISFGFYLIE